MSKPRETAALRIMALALVLAVMGALLGPGTAAAQSERPIIVNYLAGPYTIGVLTEKSSLSVGRVIFTITVHDTASGEPAGDATVVIRTRHQSEGTEGWSSAFNSPADPETYSAQILLETPGVWDAFIEITGPRGVGAVSVGSLGVPHARTYASGSYVFFGIFAALMAGGGLPGLVGPPKPETTGGTRNRGPRNGDGHGRLTAETPPRRRQPAPQ